ncbi:MAG TPA: hypothetical protein VHI13_18255 [Candidatus Kapabacteria bacterium]|nr:hypothetical protein [Candidatus Kapabacteria bacterium]
MNTIRIPGRRTARTLLRAAAIVVATVAFAGTAARAQVGPCQDYNVVLVNIPPGLFPLSVGVNYSYGSSTATATHTYSATGTSSFKFKDSGGDPVGGTVTTVDVLGNNIPADNRNHFFSSGGCTFKVAVGPTFPGPCPTTVDVECVSCP